MYNDFSPFIIQFASLIIHLYIFGRVCITRHNLILYTSGRQPTGLQHPPYSAKVPSGPIYIEGINVIAQIAKATSSTLSLPGEIMRRQALRRTPPPGGPGRVRSRCRIVRFK